MALEEANQGGTTTMALGCKDVECASKDMILEAVRMARESDVVVLVLGLDTSQENEGKDRTHLDLPGHQLDLALKVLSLDKPTCLLVLNGGMVSMDEFKDRTHLAVLEAFYPSTKGARAIAEVVFGDISPSGKLPYTIYPRGWDEQVDLRNMSMTTGPGRTYRYYQGQPLWPFGWGLTYSTLSFQTQEEEEPSFTATTPHSLITLTINITNTGDHAIDDVILVYLVPTNISFLNPGPTIKSQLIDFRRLSKLLQPGEIMEQSFQYSVGDVLVLVDGQGNRVIAPGDYQIVVSNSQAVATATIKWDSKELVLEKFPSQWKPQVSLQRKERDRRRQRRRELLSSHQ